MTHAAPGQVNLDEVPLWGPRGIDCFQMLEQIGEGTHGKVFKAMDIGTGERVAVKKIRMINERQGLPRSAIREIKILKKLDDQNVIRLKEIVTSPGPERDEQGRPVDGNKYKRGIYMVFEYMDHDLAGLSKRPSDQFSLPQIKFYMRQLLTGLLYCHDNKVLHRDIKGANLLIDNKGNLKLADFGMARFFSGEQDEQDKSFIFLTQKKDEILTDGVITRWYRPPELLLGSTKYGPEVDMWSVGCVFSELLLGKPIFPGEDMPDQLKKIFEICGTPDENNWPGVTELPRYNTMVQQHPIERRIREVFKYFDHYAVDLLDKMLTLDPKKRISEKDALDAEYFSTDPLPMVARYLSRGRSPPSYGGRRGRSPPFSPFYGGRRGRSSPLSPFYGRRGGSSYGGRRGGSSYGGRRGRSPPLSPFYGRRGGSSYGGRRSRSPPLSPFYGGRRGRSSYGGRRGGSSYGGRRGRSSPLSPFYGRRGGSSYGGCRGRSPPLSPFYGRRGGSSYGGRRSRTPPLSSFYGGRRGRSSYGGRRGGSSYGGRRGGSSYGGRRSRSPPLSPFYGGRRGRSSYGGRRGGSSYGGRRGGSSYGGRRGRSPPLSPFYGRRGSYGGRRSRSPLLSPFYGRRGGSSYGGRRSRSPPLSPFYGRRGGNRFGGVRRSRSSPLSPFYGGRRSRSRFW